MGSDSALVGECCFCQEKKNSESILVVFLFSTVCDSLSEYSAVVFGGKLAFLWQYGNFHFGIILVRIAYSAIFAVQA